MQNKFRGVMQSPITPLKDDYSLDLPTFEKVLDFHVRTGAPAISWPHHKGESLSLTIPERKRFAEATVKVVAGRVPVTIHVSALAVEDTMELAQHAQEIGADGILAITPYFWTPSLAAVRRRRYPPPWFLVYKIHGATGAVYPVPTSTRTGSTSGHGGE